MKITSRENSKIRYLHRLQTQKNFRKKEKLFLVEGTTVVRTALENEISLKDLILCPDLCREYEEIRGLAEKAGIAITEVSTKCFEKISDVKTPQGAAAAIRRKSATPEQILGCKNAVVICCHGIQDPGNLGTLIRTADAAGASGVITFPPSASFYNPKCIRSSSGSILRVPAASMKTPDFVREVKARDFHLYAATPSGGQDFRKIDFQRPCCLIIGSEAHGLPPSLFKISQPVTIPMRKGVESLNAAISGSLILYQMIEKNS